jgi:hypothetical protein
MRMDTGNPGDQTGTPFADRKRVSTEMRRLAIRFRGRQVAVGELVRHVGDEAMAGWLLLLLAVPSLIPSPGVPIGLFAGVAMALIAVQLIAGTRPLRLPGWMTRRHVQGRDLRYAAVRAQPLLRRLERLVRPRHGHLTRGLALRLLGLFVLLHGILIALPIPFGNTAPGFSVLVLALGMIARDGLTVAAGFGISVIAFAISAGLSASAFWVAQQILS